jgi:dolichol-phosphate mannosyltransferase
MFRAHFLVLLAGLLLAVVGWMSWSPEATPSLESAAHLAKAKDLIMSLRSEGGLAWWSPSFLGGSPLVTNSGTLLASLWVYFWASVFGDLDGVRLAIFLLLPVCGLTMLVFAGRVCGQPLMATLVALVYVLNPSLWTKVSMGDFPGLLALAVLPLVGWSILFLAQNPSPLSGALCGFLCSLLAVTHSKAALLAAPALVVFGLWALWKYRGVASWLQPRVWVPGVVAVFLLGVVPNLPSLREAGSAVLFEFGPLGGWQQTFSSKSALHFFDRLGMASTDFRGDFAVSNIAGATYLGLVPLLALAAVLILRNRFFNLEAARLASAFRVSFALALFCFWLSHGPFSVFSGTLRALEASTLAPDVFPAILWVLLAVQGWVVMALLPETMPLRKLVAILLLTIYLLVPGFETLSWLPLYSSLRAPFDFYQVAGIVWAALASGIAMGLILDRLPSRKIRTGALVLAAAIWGVDFSGHLGLAAKRALEPRVMPDFYEAAEALRTNSRPGSVTAVSGRYFYLQLPHLSGRPLSQEAFQSYLQQRGFAALLTAGTGSIGDYLESQRLAGVGFVLIDLKDPDLPKDFVTELQKRLPAIFKNEHFEILELDGSLAPAFRAKNAVLLASSNFQDIAASLDASYKNFAVIGPVLPGVPAGTIADGKLTLTKEFESKIGVPFDPLPAGAVRRLTPGSFEVDSPGGGGWLVIPEAWHRDWQVSVDGVSQVLFTGFGGLLAAEAGEIPRTLTFQFTPPWWYPVCAVIGILSWIAAAGLGVILLIPRVRQAAFLSETPLPPSPGFDRQPVQKPLAISPTYNEAASLPALLQQLLASHATLHVLIVDDGSPDGTAGLVKAHPEFGHRLHLLERAGKLGLGSAYREGFQWAEARGYDACLEIDADLSHDPADVPRLIQGLDDGFDAAIGSRYLNGLRVVNWPEDRLLISSFATQFVRFILGMPLTDATSGFKALRVQALQNLHWKNIRAEGYGFQVELHHALWKSGAKITEVPITFTERREGHTKMTLGIALEAAGRVLELATTPCPNASQNP